MLSNAAAQLAFSQESSLQQLLGIYTSDLDIDIYFQKYNTKTNSFSWNEEKKKSMLIFFFSDNICQIINANLSKTYADLENLVKERVNKDRLGNSTSILAARYDNNLDIEKFVTSKFSVFKLNNFDATQIKLWLDSTLPSNLQMSNYTSENVIYQLKIYREESLKKREQELTILNLKKQLDYITKISNNNNNSNQLKSTRYNPYRINNDKPSYLNNDKPNYLNNQLLDNLENFLFDLGYAI